MPSNASSKDEYKKLKMSEFIGVSRWVFSLLFSVSPFYTILYLIGFVIAQLQAFAWAYIFGKTIDQLIKVSQSPNPQLSDMYTYIAMFLVFGLFFAAMRFVRGHSYISLNNLSRYKIKQKFYYKLKELGIQTLEQPFVNDKVFRAHSNLQMVVTYYQRMIETISDIVRMITAMALVFQLIPLFVPIIVVITIPYVLYDKRLRSIFYRFDFENTEDSRKAEANFTNLSQLKILEELLINNAFGFIDKKFIEFQSWFVRNTLNIRKKWGWGDNFFSFIADVGIVFGYTQVFIKLLGKQVTVGQVTFWMSALETLRVSVSDTAEDFSALSEFAVQIKDTYLLFQLKPIFKDGTRDFPKLEKGPRIVLKNVSFKYPNSEKFIYESFNLKIKSGEKVAIVGPNGAGKTTLVRLISRMYKATGGNILINNQELSTMKADTWYQNIGVMYQDYNTYSQLTAKENIYLGNPSEPIDEVGIRLAAQAADAMDFINAYPNKFDQILSERYKGGLRPSTGQWQKIAIARFFYRNSPLVIFDEPTSSVDAISEYNIFNQIYEFFKGKTVIIISHRYSTVRNADRIIYIDHGHIVEEGSHDELMKLNGSYAKAFNVQAQGYTTGTELTTSLI